MPRPQLRVLPPPLAGPGELGGAAICDQQAGASPPGVHHAAALCLVTVLYCTVLYCVVSGLAECLLATDGAMVAGAGSTAPRRQGAGPAQARANSRAAQFVPLICWVGDTGICGMEVSIVRRRML